jgi:Protein of unknown function (DUF2511)
VRTVLLIAAAFGGGCGGDDSGPSARREAIRVSASDFPRGQWPLTVNEGELRCEGEAAVIFTAPGLRDYGINAAAVRRGFPPLENLWKRKPGRPRELINITPLLDRGAALCRRRR